jgi:hypothetical protein
MAELKTKPSEASVEDFLNGVADEQKREDCFSLLGMMKEVTGLEPQMWGDSIIGFGTYHYKYKSGHEGDWFLTGFAPRKRNLTVYIMAGFDQYGALLEKLGKYSTGVGCLYLKKLVDVDQDTLQTLVKQSVEHIKQTNP